MKKERISVIFNLDTLKPKERKELDAETMEKYHKHYINVLTSKFGLMRDDTNSTAFDTVARYIALWQASDEGKCDKPAKGLFLFGTPGAGKTTLMKMFSGLCEVQFITMLELTKDFALGQHERFWKTVDQFNGVPLIVDDLGGEDSTKSYGNEVPIPDFIRQREELWKNKGIITCYTSNAAKRDDITARYGSSICSRILGMCDFVKFTGSDRRIVARKECA
jgi:DNA replication protein DnaC